MQISKENYSKLLRKNNFKEFYKSPGKKSQFLVLLVHNSDTSEH